MIPNYEGTRIPTLNKEEKPVIFRKPIILEDLVAGVKSKARGRTKSLKMKTNSSADKIFKISSSFNAIEVQRIITRDGFGYFSTTND